MFAMLQFAWLLIFVAVCGVHAEAAQYDGDADIAEYPYVVSIRKNGRHICSGAIINEYHIVTSERCVPPFKHTWNVMNNIVIVTGTNSLKFSYSRIRVKEMFSQNHHINPSDNPVTTGLGVIRLTHSLQFGDKVQPIELSSTEIPAGVQIQMVGWAAANHEGKRFSGFRKVILESVNREECQQYYRKDLTENEFCTKSKSQGVCKGDVGSPLIYEGKLAGFATYGISCDNDPIPDIHPAMYKNIDYINDIVKS